MLNFSGFLVSSLAVHASGGARIFWGHGTRDTSIPFELAQHGRDCLVAAGTALKARDYEIGHWIAPNEISDAMAFLER